MTTNPPASTPENPQAFATPGETTLQRLVELAESAVSHAESAEREADYGVPTFGPSDADRYRTELEALHEPLADLFIQLSGSRRHASDCATSSAPAEMPGPCDCKLERGK